MPVEGEEGRGYKQEENDPRRDSEEQQVRDFVMYVHTYVSRYCSRVGACVIPAY